MDILKNIYENYPELKKGMDQSLKNISKDEKIAVAMSGGVDSTLVAALLKMEGYDVIGITMITHNECSADEMAEINKNLKSDEEKQKFENQFSVVRVAKISADELDIPLNIIDCREQFKEKVIDYFIDSYKKGETPNPCSVCNRDVKFIELIDEANRLGAKYLATGHYVAINRDKHGAHISRGADTKRDQSYFLFDMSNEQINSLVFLLPYMSKPKVRDITKKLNLSSATWAASNDLCFAPIGHYTDFVLDQEKEKSQKGKIYHINGELLGEHKGTIYYTVGQRRGLGVYGENPLYVIEIDVENNRIIVGSKKDLDKELIKLHEINWLDKKSLSDYIENEIDIFTKIRSTGKLHRGLIKKDDEGYYVALQDTDFGISPGQACVFYNSDEAQSKLLGGAYIRK